MCLLLVEKFIPNLKLLLPSKAVEYLLGIKSRYVVGKVSGWCLISFRNVHNSRGRQEGLRSSHWCFSLSDLGLNGNCNNMSALITSFIFHAISAVWHVSCCTCLWSDQTCQRQERGWCDLLTGERSRFSSSNLPQVAPNHGNNWRLSSNGTQRRAYRI